MSKGRPRLPRVKPVGRAAFNHCPPQRARHLHRDGDLAYGMPETAGHAAYPKGHAAYPKGHAWENWPQRETTPYGVASAAWAGYLAHP